MEARRPQALEAGLFPLVVALPLALFPLSARSSWKSSCSSSRSGIWIRRQLELFPNDDVRVPTEEPGYTPPS